MARRGAITALAAVAIVAAIVVLALPPRRAPRELAWKPTRSVVAGAFHVHTNRSDDSSGTIDEAAAAAGRAGLQFVIATEHGDGTREPLPPAYHSGILWIDGVEISTTDGHYATFGMTRSPYPLAGDARDVAEDVKRLGGVGVAAHGDSQKSEAQWRDWDAPIDGLEWLNLDSVWRDAGAFSLARAAVTYFFRPAATLAALASRPDATLAHLDRLAGARHVIALAASDAHGHAVPSYDACFGAFSTRVELERPLVGEAAADAATLLAALKAGHHYTLIDGLSSPGSFEFTAQSGGKTAHEGDRLPEGQPVLFDIHVGGAPEANTVLLRDGVPVQESRASSWRHETDGRPGAYRVEVTLPGGPGHPPLPWIVSNPIFVGISGAVADASSPIDGATAVGSALDWQAEKDPASTASVDTKDAGLMLRYTLGKGAPTNQFAAAAAGAPALFTDARALHFTVRADHPLRFSVELRAKGDMRWQRSVYADTTPRTVTVSFDDMRPVQPNTAAHPAPASVEALLLLVGVSNTAPGTSGELALGDVAVLKY